MAPPTSGLSRGGHLPHVWHNLPSVLLRLLLKLRQLQLLLAHAGQLLPFQVSFWHVPGAFHAGFAPPTGNVRVATRLELLRTAQSL